MHCHRRDVPLQRCKKCRKGSGIRGCTTCTAEGFFCGNLRRRSRQGDIRAVVNMIGFDVDDAGQKALKAVAEAGKETYAVAASGVDLKEHLKMEYARLGRKDLETTRRSGKWMQWTMR